MAPLEGLEHGPGDAREDLWLRIRVDAGLEAGEQEQVLDHPEQPFRLAGDVGHHGFAVRGGEAIALVPKQAGVAEDRRHRRPQLVGDETQELVLHSVRGAQRLGRGPQRVLDIDPIGDVDEDVNRADHRPVGVTEHRRVRREGHPRAVWSLCDRLDAAQFATVLQRHRHRTLVVGHRRAVRVEQLVRAAPQLAELGPAAPECGCRVVEEGQSTLAIGGVDGNVERLEHLPRAPLGGTPAHVRLDERPHVLDETFCGSMSARCLQRDGVGVARVDAHDTPRYGNQSLWPSITARAAESEGSAALARPLHGSIAAAVPPCEVRRPIYPITVCCRRPPSVDRPRGG